MASSVEGAKQMKRTKNDLEKELNEANLSLGHGLGASLVPLEECTRCRKGLKTNRFIDKLQVTYMVTKSGSE
jgi:hypothetical protein